MGSEYTVKLPGVAIVQRYADLDRLMEDMRAFMESDNSVSRDITITRTR